MKKIPINIRTLAVMAALAASAFSSHAQQLYSQDFETDQNASGNWVTNALATSPADLYFDYGSIGIPSAPHSSGGTTRGVKLNANLGNPIGAPSTGVFPGGVSVSPLDFSLSPSTNFVINCDVWINFNGPAPAGGSGSTQIGGIGFATAGATAQVATSVDSFFAVATGEGGSGDDYRLYSAAVPTSLLPATGAYYAGTAADARNNSAASQYYATNFLGQTAPAAQVSLYTQQSGTTANGTQGWKWRDWQILKLGPIVTWSIDGIPIATVNLTTNGTSGGSSFGGERLLLTQSDINAGNSVDVNAAALSFALFDNLRVSNVLANVVGITAPSPDGAETGPTPITFTVTRTITGSPTAVTYSIGGTASNGVDYTNALGGALSGTVVFNSSDTETNITIVPIDDQFSEAKETVILTILSGPGYVATGNATATITDNDAVLLIASIGFPSMYERHTNDYAGVTITRWGDTSQQLFMEASNFTYAGSAVLNTDFVVNSNVFPFSLDAGVAVTTNKLVSPLDNSVYNGNKTIVVGLASSADFQVTSSNASLTIIDDENPTAAVLYTNSLTSAADAVNWNVTFANGDINLPQDYEASFGYDLTTDVSGGGVISPPRGGANNALRTTVNKNTASNAGVNLYPTNQLFSGNFAVRFNMNIIVDSAGGTTQGPVFGINHTGFQTNWWAGSGVVAGGPWAMDGVWYWVSADGGAAAGDYIERIGAGGVLPNGGFTQIASQVLGTFGRVFKQNPPYTGYVGPGLISNDPPGANNATWSDVEIKQVRNVVTLSINKQRIFNYTNTTTFTNGTVMLGYGDPFNSIGAPAGAVYYANLSVVRLTGPVITKISRSGTTVTIDFTTTDGTDTTDSFALQGAAVVTGPYTDVAGTPVFTQFPSGAFRVVATSTAGTQFFRIRHR